MRAQGASFRANLAAMAGHCTHATQRARIQSFRSLSRGVLEPLSDLSSAFTRRRQALGFSLAATAQPCRASHAGMRFSSQFKAARFSATGCAVRISTTIESEAATRDASTRRYAPAFFGPANSRLASIISLTIASATGSAPRSRTARSDITHPTCCPLRGEQGRKVGTAQCRIVTASTQVGSNDSRSPRGRLVNEINLRQRATSAAVRDGFDHRNQNAALPLGPREPHRGHQQHNPEAAVHG